VKLALSEWYSLPSAPRVNAEQAEEVLRKKVTCVVRRTK